MTDLDARLDTIQARVEANEGQHRGGPYWAMEALADCKMLVAALRAVLDLGAEVGHPLDIELRERISAALEAS